MLPPPPRAECVGQAEFDSKVADIKISIKDRSNAQASCAANFIYAHIHEDCIRAAGCRCTSPAQPSWRSAAAGTRGLNAGTLTAQPQALR